MTTVTDPETLTRVPVSGGAILLCAATRWEVNPLVRRLGLRPSQEGRYEGSLNNRPVVMIHSGMGPMTTADSLERLGPDARYAYALSVGFAGALQPGMASGDIVVDLQGLESELPRMMRDTAQRLGINVHFGRIVHSDRVLNSPQEKADRGDRERAAAVDMESSALRAWAARKSIPALAIRAVLDRRDDRMPAGQPSGENFLSLMSYALKNVSDLPLMISIGLKQRRAIEALGRFLESLLPRL